MMVDPCDGWFPKAAILSRSCLATHFLEDAFAEAWRFNSCRRVIALIKVPFGKLTAFGKMLRFAATSAILTISRFIQRLRISHQFELFGKIERPEEELDFFDESVEITVRIVAHSFGVWRKPRCVVTMNLPKEGPQSKAQIAGTTSIDNELRHRKGDYKLPLWVR
jgi:hypothetical protein